VCKVVDDVRDARQVREHAQSVQRQLTTSKYSSLRLILVETDQVPRRVLAADSQQVAGRRTKTVLANVVLLKHVREYAQSC